MNLQSSGHRHNMPMNQIEPSRAPDIAQIRAHERIARLRTDKFSPAILWINWVTFILLHFLCFLYFTLTSWCYWNLPGTRLDRWLSMLNIGMGTEYDRMIAVVHAAVAVIHAAYIAWMIGWSLHKQALVFAVYNVFKCPYIDLSSVGGNHPLLEKIEEGVGWVYRAVFTRDGFLGVDGPNFDFVILCREIVETALQTHQGYRMSLLMPRRELNRGYVALLVLNCWSTALVHTLFEGNATRRRLLALVCDCVLDLVSSVGLPMVLVGSYISDFDFKVYGFPFLKWYEDVWRVHAMSEFKMILVTSWGDLVIRFIFALSMLGNLNNMKKLMRARPTKAARTERNTHHRATVVAPFHASLAHLQNSMPHFTGANAESVHGWVERCTKVGFFAWGLIILILHLHAESIVGLPQCKMQVKPWTSYLPSCSLLELNCHESGITGSKEDITAQWSSFDPKTVVRVVIQHCSHLVVPPKLSEFSQLKEFKLYNTTIVSWDETAALTDSYHPMLTTLFLIRVNMTNGELPLGLQDDDFPLALDDIEFCVTNLRSLPEDLDLKWPQYASIYLEASQFEQVPASLTRLAPYDLSLSMNPITTLPKELFESDSVGYLSFGGTLISELPQDVSALSLALYDINLSDTNISFFWHWIDPFVLEPTDYPPITAGNSPYCLDVERIFEGEQTSFSSIPTIDVVEVSILLDASVSNWGTLINAVSCKWEDSTWYPLEFEDEYSQLN